MSSRGGSVGPMAIQSTDSTTGAARASWCASKVSCAGSGSGSLKITSSPMALGRASASRDSKVACTARGHGQRPMAATLASSIATRVMPSGTGRRQVASPMS